MTDLFGPTVRYDEAYPRGKQPLDTGPLTPDPIVVMEGTDLPTDPADDQRASYCSFLTNGLLLQDETEARRLLRWAKSFVMIGEDLYEKGHIEIKQLCTPIEQGKWLLKDIHNGTYGHHATPRSLVENAFR